MVEKQANTFDQREAVKDLKSYYTSEGASHKLKDLLQNTERNEKMRASIGEDIILDFTHTNIDERGFELLQAVGTEAKIFDKLEAMFTGQIINNTEKRSVLHVALRMSEGETLTPPGSSDGDVVAKVHQVLKRIKEFSSQVRSGEIKGYSGKALKNIIPIGIGGSFLGPEFVYEALRQDEGCKKASEGFRMRFLANVDPIDFHRAIEGLDIEETLVVIVSKTFTTAETMLNARTLRQAIIDHYKAKHPEEADHSKFVEAHMCAVSTNLPDTAKFGIKDERVFGFWDWVGGRFSVCSAVGALPLSLFYGFEKIECFLKGIKSIDEHVRHTKDLTKNLPVLLALIGFYNTYITDHASRAILPYSQALLKFASHIQQLDMESNGKTVSKDGVRFTKGVDSGPIIFGEPGTNGQHSFYQLMHQGRVIPAEFIGFVKSQTPVSLPAEPVSNHEELMSNFFAQPDALALGKDREQLEKEGVPDWLREHKLFEGNRPSLSILFTDKLTPYTCGQLLGLYEHRVAIEGFIYDINSFDQWGVELGKVLAKDVRNVFQEKTKGGSPDASKFNPATKYLLEKYLNNM